MNKYQALFCLLTITLISLVACEGGETTECVCTDGTCVCPDDYGLEKVEVFVTYALNDGQEAAEAGMEVEGTRQLMYDNQLPQPISCKTKLQNTTDKLQCSLGLVAVDSEIRFMVMVPDGDKLVPACMSSHRSECRGILKVEILRENGTAEFPEDILVTDKNFEGLVSYRVRLEDK
jgi:hypothetical protein